MFVIDDDLEKAKELGIIRLIIIGAVIMMMMFGFYYLRFMAFT